MAQQSISTLNEVITLSKAVTASWSKVGTEAKFDGSVASTIWSEQPTTEIDTRVHMSVRDCVLGSIFEFRCATAVVWNCHG